MQHIVYTFIEAESEFRNIELFEKELIETNLYLIVSVNIKISWHYLKRSPLLFQIRIYKRFEFNLESSILHLEYFDDGKLRKSDWTKILESLTNNIHQILTRA